MVDMTKLMNSTMGPADCRILRLLFPIKGRDNYLTDTIFNINGCGEILRFNTHQFTITIETN